MYMYLLPCMRAIYVLVSGFSLYLYSYPYKVLFHVAICSNMYLYVSFSNIVKGGKIYNELSEVCIDFWIPKGSEEFQGMGGGGMPPSYIKIVS